MNREEALYLLKKTTAEYAAARDRLEEAQRTIESSRLIIQGIMRAFPDLSHELDLAEVTDTAEGADKPRGSEAVLEILLINENKWFSIQELYDRLDAVGWLPASANPPNAIRTAVERLVKTPGSHVHKSREADGTVVYSYMEPEEEPEPHYDADPF